MDGETMVQMTVLIAVFVTGAVITVSILWLEYRRRSRALDVLRAYAERGEEPPASVIEALANAAGRTPAPAPRTPPTRGNHLARAAANAVLALGLAGLASWRIVAFGDTSGGVGLILLAALFFTACLAARLVGAYYAPER
jgi:hypothetical protein